MCRGFGLDLELQIPDVLALNHGAILPAPKVLVTLIDAVLAVSHADI